MVKLKSQQVEGKWYIAVDISALCGFETHVNKGKVISKS
jgi:hypothetical protein